MDLRPSERGLNLVVYVHIYEARGLGANHRRIFKLRLLNNKGLTKLVLSEEWCGLGATFQKVTIGCSIL